MADTTETCSTSTWQKLPFLPNSPTPGFNPTEWTGSDFKGYARGTLLGATAVNTVFFGLAVILLIFLLVWRLSRCLSRCCAACFGLHPGPKARRSQLSFQVMHDPWLKAQKIALGCFAAGCITLAATGLAKLPKGQTMVVDLAVRLDAAAAHASSLLDASDSLLTAAQGLRPLMSNTSAFVAFELAPPALNTNFKAASAFMDSSLGSAAKLAATRAQLLALDAAIRTGLAPALSAAQALVNATLGAHGSADDTGAGGAEAGGAGAGVSASAALPALERVAAMPAVMDGLATTLSQYDLALAAVPASRVPLKNSGAAVAALAAAQPDVYDLIASLDELDAGVRGVAAAARQSTFARLAAALVAVRDAANDTLVDPLQPLVSALMAMDTGYLGTTQQQATQAANASAAFAGRAAMAALAAGLARYEDRVMRFATPLERGAIDDVAALAAALEALYGSPPTPLQGPLAAAQAAVGPLAEMDAEMLGVGCAAVQSYLTASLPSEAPTLSYIAYVRDQLAALIEPAAQVSAALASYNATQTDANYAMLYGNATAVHSGPAANARSAASAPKPSGFDGLASASANASAAAASAGLPADLAAVQSSVLAPAAAWLVARSSSMAAASLNADVTALAQLGTVLQGARARLVGANWNATTASTPSTLLKPLQTATQLISTTVTNGLTAVGEQLDNALGKVIAPSPPAALTSDNNHRHHHLRRSLAASTANETNTTTLVREELVERLHKSSQRLRSQQVETYAKPSYSAAIAIYAALMAAVLILLIVAILNFPAGLTVALFFALTLSGIVLLFAWAASGSLVVTSDSCASADAIVLSTVPSNSPLFALVRYYLQGVGGSLPQVLRGTGLGDTGRLTAAAQILSNGVLDPLLNPAPPGASSTSPAAATSAQNDTLSLPASNSTGGMPANTSWPGSLGAVQYSFAAVLFDLSDASDALADSLDQLLTLGSRDAVLHEYTHVTSWACCDLGGVMMISWIAATGAGLLGWLACVAAVLILKNLDDMPNAACCGCACYDPKDYPRPPPRRPRSSDGGCSSKRPSPCGQPCLPAQIAKAKAAGVAQPASLGGSSACDSSDGGAMAAAAAGGPVVDYATWAKGCALKPGAGLKPSAEAESGLFQGPEHALATWTPTRPPLPPPVVPMAAAPPPVPATPVSARAGVSRDGSAHARPQVAVCVMDQATAAAFGFGGEDLEAIAAGATLLYGGSRPQAPAPVPAVHQSPSAPPLPPPSQPPAGGYPPV